MWLDTLLGPEETSGLWVGVGVFSGRPCCWLSNAWGCSGGGGCGGGVWLFVECCIVDASILLW